MGDGWLAPIGPYQFSLFEKKIETLSHNLYYKRESEREREREKKGNRIEDNAVHISDCYDVFVSIYRIYRCCSPYLYKSRRRR